MPSICATITFILYTIDQTNSNLKIIDMLVSSSKTLTVRYKILTRVFLFHLMSIVLITAPSLLMKDSKNKNIVFQIA